MVEHESLVRHTALCRSARSLGGAVFGHSLGALRNGVLAQLLQSEPRSPSVIACIAERGASGLTPGRMRRAAV